MFIKNNQFGDEDTLFEAIYDFEIGVATPYIQEITDALTEAMQADKTIAAEAAKLDEESRLELYDDILRENLVRILLERFQSFKIYDSSLYGLNKEGETLLYSIDMY